MLVLLVVARSVFTNRRLQEPDEKGVAEEEEGADERETTSRVDFFGVAFHSMLL